MFAKRQYRLQHGITLVAATGALMLGLLAMPSTNAPVLRAASPVAAQAASPVSCVVMGRNLVGFVATRDPWLALNAARRVSGCGNFNANAICSASRQWWGEGARNLVRLATWGRYSRC
jgi:hypothetical protein